MPPRLARALRLAPFLAPALLAGCGDPANQFAPACPQLSLLTDAADLTRFAGPPGAPRDARSLLVAASITAVPAHCENPDGDTTRVQATLNVVAQVRRGPAARGDSMPVAYFVALMQGDRVLSKQDYVLTAAFRPNVDSVRATGEDVEVNVPVSKTMSAAAYHIYVGFQLTPDELAYNRAQTPSE